MHSENLAVLLTLILSFIRPGKLYKRHSSINVLEEEYFSFSCPKKAQHEGQVIHWYKGKEGEEVLIHGDSRIDLNGSNLRFWPILLNDTGIYQCCLRNGTWKISCKEWSLNVINKNKNNCFTEEHLLTGRDGIIGTGYLFTCSSTDDNANVINTTWYKNWCTKRGLLSTTTHLRSYTLIQKTLNVAKVHILVSMNGGNKYIKDPSLKLIRILNFTARVFYRWVTSPFLDCIAIENINKRGEEEWHIDQLTEKDGGKYTCVKTILHAGKKYNSTSTTNLNIKGTEEKVTPKLIGPGHNVFKTEIGKEKILNCTAFLGYSKNFVEFPYELYWIVHDKNIETCQSNSSLCQKGEHKYDENGKKYVMKQLWFKHVKEKNFNSSYKCVFSENGFEEQTFILQKESNPDLPVHAFTAGIIMAIMLSFIAVMIVILCVIFKIELVLLFRGIMGKDETLGDGKLYDAFVSYLKDCTPICGEERKFALEILPKTLEDHFGYKLCIFERDISPGGAIIDDIQSSIDRSRRLIVILSRNYVSNQVMFELEVGLHKALVERKIRVILIEYMPKNDFDFLPKSLELLSSSQVVKWKKEKSLPLNSRFWKKLCYAMPAKPTISAACQRLTSQDRRKRTNAFCFTSEPSLACY